MDEFKLVNFLRSHPGIALPEIAPLSASESLAVQTSLATRLGLPPTVSREKLVAHLDERETPISGIDAANDDFSLRAVLQAENLVPDEQVMLNWYRFNDIDRVKCSDLCTFFHDIWYPSSDDLDVFDSSYNWVISICHSGTVKVLHLRL